MFLLQCKLTCQWSNEIIKFNNYYYIFFCSEGGFFKCHLYFPKEYPLRPPKMKFVTEIWHPNSKYSNVLLSLFNCNAFCMLNILFEITDSAESLYIKFIALLYGFHLLFKVKLQKSSS